MNDILEKLVDSNGLAAVLDALSAICHEKADHIHTSYDDRVTAVSWRRAGQRVHLAAESQAVRIVTA